MGACICTESVYSIACVCVKCFFLGGGVFIFVDGARSIHRFLACPRTVLRMPCLNYRGLDGQEFAVRAGKFKEAGVVQIITSHT